MLAWFVLGWDSGAMVAWCWLGLCQVETVELWWPDVGLVCVRLRQWSYGGLMSAWFVSGWDSGAMVAWCRLGLCQVETVELWWPDVGLVCVRLRQWSYGGLMSAWFVSGWDSGAMVAWCRHGLCCYVERVGVWWSYVSLACIMCEKFKLRSVFHILSKSFVLSEGALAVVGGGVVVVGVGVGIFD